METTYLYKNSLDSKNGYRIDAKIVGKIFARIPFMTEYPCMIDFDVKVKVENPKLYDKIYHDLKEHFKFNIVIMDNDEFDPKFADYLCSTVSTQILLPVEPTYMDREMPISVCVIRKQTMVADDRYPSTVQNLTFREIFHREVIYHYMLLSGTMYDLKVRVPIQIEGYHPQDRSSYIRKVNFYSRDFKSAENLIKKVMLNFDKRMSQISGYKHPGRTIKVLPEAKTTKSE